MRTRLLMASVLAALLACRSEPPAPPKGEVPKSSRDFVQSPPVLFLSHRILEGTQEGWNEGQVRRGLSGWEREIRICARECSLHEMPVETVLVLRVSLDPEGRPAEVQVREGEFLLEDCLQAALSRKQLLGVSGGALLEARYQLRWLSSALKERPEREGPTPPEVPRETENACGAGGLMGLLPCPTP